MPPRKPAVPPEHTVGYSHSRHSGLPGNSSGFRGTRHADSPAGYPGSSRRWVGSCLAALVLLNLLVRLQALWAAEVLLVPTLLVLPGVILLRALRVPGRAIASFPVYVPAASLLVLLASGLAIDLAGPMGGIAEPLRPVPVLVTFDLFCLVMLAVSAGAPAETAIPWHPLARPARLAWPLVLPMIAAAGALRLNTGHSNAVTLIAIIAGIVLLAWLMVIAPRVDKTLLAVAIYAVALAVNWSFSLRSDLVNGFDIATEYQRLELTISAGVWNPVHVGDAYGAMLSLTVLPTGLHALSGMSGLLIFKVVYPAIFSLLPVAIYNLARYILSRRWSMVAAAFTVGQYYYAELVGFARQEIALVLFTALTAAMLDTRIARRSRWTLVAFLGIAVAVAHYSTTYLTITILGMVLPLQLAASWLRDVPRVTGSIVVAFITTLAASVIWYGPVTHSASHLGQFFSQLQADGLNLLPNSGSGTNLISAYLKGNSKAPMPAAEYARLIHQYYSANISYVVPHPAASDPLFALRNSPSQDPPVKFAAGVSGLNLVMLISVQLANLLSLIGTLTMLLRRRASLITRQVGIFALAASFFLVVIRFSGTLNMAYGQERALLQALIFLAISLCWAMQSLATRRRNRASPSGRREATVVALTVTALVVIFINTTGLRSALLGGQAPDNVANAGTAYEYYYETAPELASARWLGREVRPGQLVYADEYGQLRVDAMTKIRTGLILDLTPMTLSQHAWIYASRTNVLNRQAFALYQFRLVTYVFPLRYLQSFYNEVYTNGSSEVFNR